MKQGNKQALNMQWVESVLENEDEFASVLILLDGWITRINLFIEVITAASTVPELVSLFITQRQQFGQLSTSQTYEDPTTAFATEDLVVTHGLADMVPFMFFWDPSMDAGSFIDIELIRVIPVTKGMQLDVRFNSKNIGGANTTGEIHGLVEIKQVVSPYKKNKRKRS